MVVAAVVMDVAVVVMDVAMLMAAIVVMFAAVVMMDATVVMVNGSVLVAGAVLVVVAAVVRGPVEVAHDHAGFERIPHDRSKCTKSSHRVSPRPVSGGGLQGPPRAVRLC